jgi:PadR family transcriptional regulator, regulatory protein PadR
MRSTYPTAAVLYALARGLGYGFEIIDRTGLRAGTVYPILRRLESEKLVSSSWEDASVAQAESRPPRRNYRMTREGMNAAREAAERYPLVRGMFDGLPDGAEA